MRLVDGFDAARGAVNDRAAYSVKLTGKRSRRTGKGLTTACQRTYRTLTFPAECDMIRGCGRLYP